MKNGSFPWATFTLFVPILLALGLPPVAAEQIPLGYGGEYLNLGAVRRVDDEIPGYRPYQGSLISAVNRAAKQALFTWDRPNGYSPPQYVINTQLLTSQGDHIGSTQTLRGALPGTGEDQFSEFIPQLAFNQTTNQYHVISVAQRYPNHDPLGPAGRLISSAGLQVSNPASVGGVGRVNLMQYNPNDNNFLAIGWETEPRHGVFGAILDSSGALQSALNRLDAAPADPVNTGISALSLSTASNKYLAVWVQDNSRRYIKGQFIDHLGNLLGTPIELAASPDPWTGGYYDIEVAYDSARDQLLVANDAVQNVRARLIKANGDFVGEDFELASSPVTTPGGISDFSLEFDDVQQRYLLASIRNQKSLDLRVFSQDGKQLGNMLTAATVTNNMFEVELASFGGGNYYAAWTTASLFGSSTQIQGRSLQLVPEPGAAAILLSILAMCSMRYRTA